MVDIKSCHPTFWSYYIYNIYSSSLPIHYVGVFSDIVVEHNKWVELFTNNNIDGREVISTQLGITTDRTKQLLNSAINGSQNIVFEWIATNFPNLFQYWVNHTNVKQTGCNISKMFEGRLLRTPDLYNMVSTLHMTIIDEHDGFTVFGSNDDLTLLSNINVVISYLKGKSEELFGIPIKVGIEHYIIDGEVPILKKIGKNT